MIKKGLTASTTVKPPNPLAVKVCKAADKYSMTVRGYVVHTDLLTEEGIDPKLVTPEIINEAIHLTKVWDHNIQERVAAWNKGHGHE